MMCAAAPPENNREKIMAASLALMVGDWKTCSEHILQLRVRRVNSIVLGLALAVLLTPARVWVAVDTRPCLGRCLALAYVACTQSWDLTPDAAAVKAMLATKIREEGQPNLSQDGKFLC